MAEGLIPKAENLQLEDIEILTKDQIKHELGLANPSTSVLHHLKHTFLECGINLDPLGTTTTVSLWKLPIHKLRINVLMLRTIISDLILYSPHFRQYELSAQYGAQINYPYAMSMEDYFQKFFQSVQLNNSGMLKVQSKKKHELITAIEAINNIIATMCCGEVPFHLWPIPQQLL